MHLAEFQIESSQQGTHGRSTLGRVPEWFGSEQAQAGVESLLLGLHFRSWLSDSEKNLLDLLAPEHSVAFMIHNRRYLHPEDFELFPPELIETSLSGGGEAIFAHRYEPPARTEVGRYRICTARVSLSPNDELVLGMLCRERVERSQDRDNHFECLVTLFRKAWQMTDDVASTLADRYDVDHPCMVINRTSGRVLATNDLLADMVGSNQRTLVDSEYSRLGSRFTEAASDHRLQFQNLEVGGMHLCVVSILPERRAPADIPRDDFSSEFFLHTACNKLTAITAAASHLKSLGEETGSGDQIELSEIILAEADNLESQLNRLNLLVNYKDFQPESTNIAKDLARAVALFRKRHESTVRLEVDITRSNRTIKTPPSGLVILVEAVLMSHLTPGGQESKTVVTLAVNSQTTDIRILTTFSGSSQDRCFDCNWQMYTRRLAQLMHFTLEQDSLPGGEALRTSLQIPDRKE